MEADKKTAWFQRVWGKYKYALLVALIGVVLLAWPDWKPKDLDSSTVQSRQTEEDAEAMERRMRAILSQIDGVGELELMLTVESTNRQEYAMDTELSYSGQTAAPDDYSRRTETVVVSGSGGDGPVVARNISPAYRGALVVCEGGGNAEVKLAVTEAVASLTGLSSDRITVVKKGRGSAG